MLAHVYFAFRERHVVRTRTRRDSADYIAIARGHVVRARRDGMSVNATNALDLTKSLKLFA